MPSSDWGKLRGCVIKEVTREGDLEWAKQNGLENCVYLITDKGTVALDVDTIDDPDGKPYLTIDFSW